MHNDNRFAGRSLSRRRALGLFGATAAAALAQGARGFASSGETPSTPPDCIAIPELTPEPFVVDRARLRSNLRDAGVAGLAIPGAPLRLRFELSRFTPAGGRVVLPNAQVDIRHCDAMGIGPDVDGRDGTAGGDELRGAQVSDGEGVAELATIYPGWERGHAVHVRFRVRAQAPGGGTHEFTSRLYFSDELTDVVHAGEPYSLHLGQRLFNERDMLFRESGSPLVLPVVETDGGYSATFRIALQARA